MPNRLIPILPLFLATVAGAEVVQLPYSPPDSTGEQWMIYPQGNLQQQGNQPVFGQAGAITINGQQPQQNDQNGNLDTKTNTLSLNFAPQGNLHATRQIRFDENNPIVRVVDTFENLSGNEVTANVVLTSSVNTGVNDAAAIPDTKTKDANIGWTANTQFNRAALSLFSGKRSKVLPRVNFHVGNNVVTAQMTLKIPAKSKVAIVHWHGTFENTEASLHWVDQLKEDRSVADLPPDTRKMLVNLGGGGTDFVAGREMLRGGASDVIELAGGQQLRGTLKAETFTLATAYGQLKLSPDKIAGLLSVGGVTPRQLLVTRAGEVFAGAITEPTLPLLLGSGQTVAVPYAQITRVGVKSTGEPAPWKFDKPMVFLTGGERCEVELPSDPIAFVTRYGSLTLSANQISTVLLPAEGEVQTIYLSDGSKLSGVIAQPKWPLKLTSAGKDAMDFALASLARVQFSALPENVGTGQSTATLLGTDLVAAKIDGTLKLKTPFDTIDVDPAQISWITRPDRGQPDVQITLFDGSSFRGTLETPSLTLELPAGVKLDVPIAALTDYQNPRPFPASAVAEQAAAAIKQLNAEDWKQREEAEKQLMALGSAVVPVLEEAKSKQPIEARERIEGLVTRLRKDQPEAPSRMQPPPAMD